MMRRTIVCLLLASSAHAQNTETVTERSQATARAILDRAVTATHRSAPFVASLARAKAAAGDSAGARVLLRELETRATRVYVPSYEVAKVHLALGEARNGVAAGHEDPGDAVAAEPVADLGQLPAPVHHAGGQVGHRGA